MARSSRFHTSPHRLFPWRAWALATVALWALIMGLPVLIAALERPMPTRDLLLIAGDFSWWGVVRQVDMIPGIWTVRGWVGSHWAGEAILFVLPTLAGRIVLMLAAFALALALIARPVPAGRWALALAAVPVAIVLTQFLVGLLYAGALGLQLHRLHGGFRDTLHFLLLVPLSLLPGVRILWLVPLAAVSAPPGRLWPGVWAGLWRMRTGRGHWGPWIAIAALMAGIVTHEGLSALLSPGNVVLMWVSAALTAGAIALTLGLVLRQAFVTYGPRSVLHREVTAF